MIYRIKQLIKAKLWKLKRILGNTDLEKLESWYICNYINPRTWDMKSISEDHETDTFLIDTYRGCKT